MSAPGLYVHVPYCETKCPYCDFVCASSRDLPHPRRFLDALARDLEEAAGPYETIFVGGGTPTALGLPLFRRLLALLAPRLRGGGEWTVEANPVSLTREKAFACAEAGVTRVSLGVQSVRDEELAFLGRLHRHADTERAVADLRAAGIENISVDLIFGLPRGRLSASLEWVCAEGFPHVSLYDLTIESGTPFAARAARGEKVRTTNDRAAAQYRAARARLAACGYENYEVSNFARPGYECRHNLGYWTGKAYDAAGPGAHAFHPDGAGGGVRRVRTRDVARYLEEPAWEDEETLGPEDLALDACLLALRTTRGLRRDDWGAAFEAARAVGEPALREAEREGLLEIASDRVVATETGRFFLDGLLARIAENRYSLRATARYRA